jgi:hypothetical protein
MSRRCARHSLPTLVWALITDYFAWAEASLSAVRWGQSKRIHISSIFLNDFLKHILAAISTRHHMIEILKPCSSINNR